MISLRQARRSAERFEALLEGYERDAVDPRTAELLELVGAMRSLPQPQSRPEFAVDLRERLMLAAQTELVTGQHTDGLGRRLTVAPRPMRRDRRVAVALGGFAIIGATTTMAVAAQSALPGDVLYPLKLAIENAEAGVAVSDDAKGTTILANARGRLDEIDKLTREGDSNASDIATTLNTFASQADEASDLLLADYAQTGDESSINELRDFTVSSIASLAALEAVIPANAEDALLHATQVLFDIDAATVQACPTCLGEGLTEIPPQLVSLTGPVVVDVPESGSGTESVQAAPHQPKPAKDPKPSQAAEQPSGLDAPSDPVSVPSPSEADGGSQTNPPKQPDEVTVNVGTGGKPGKKDKGPVKDAADAVEDVVKDVADGVGDTLGGLGVGGQ